MSADPNDQHISRIEAATYKPYEGRTEQKRFSLLSISLTVLAVLAALTLFFLFTAKSVTLTFSAPPNDTSISGGASLSLGGVYLMRQGTYTVAAHADGYEPLNVDIDVTDARQQELHLNFTPLPGLVNFDLEPEDASVSFDGTPVDTLADAPIRITAGEHEVHIRHPRYQPQTLIYQVEGREQHQTLKAILRPNWGNIRVSSTPVGASVHIDGKATGAFTPAVVEVLAGEREISVHREGYRSARVRLVVAAEGDDEIPEFKLVQADARVSVRTEPKGAGITVNGEFIGQSPLDLTLKSTERYRIEAILEGHRRGVATISLSKGQNPPVQLQLQRELGDVNVQAQPAGAQLRIDGQLIGDANRNLRLPTRPHKLEVVLDGYAAYKTTVHPRAGIAQAVKVKLLTVEEARRRALKPRYTSTAGQEMVLIEPGSLSMGASRREPGRRANETLREVTLTRLYYLSRQEVTNAQYRAFIASHDSGEFQENTLNQDNQPVVDVGWIDAVLYCNWLSEQEQRTPYYEVDVGQVVSINVNATGYRLPTEAEWAWAARTIPGSDQPPLRYPWGSNLPPPDRHGNYADRAAQHLVGRTIYGYNDNYVAASPVGSFDPNAYDLYDMGGNVAEWTHDFYAIPSKEPTTDPTGPLTGDYHVIKGSSWMHGTITDLRLSFRDYGTDGRKDLGFRIARNAE